MFKIAKRILAFGLLLSIAGCARHYVDVPQDDPYGFFSGFWHGLIFPITVTVNLFSWLFSLIDINFFQDVEIIGRPNTGFLYYLGFFFGIGAVARANPG